MAGRPPLPTAIKQLQGTERPSRVNDLEPEPPVVEVGTQPPDWLIGTEARAYWAELVELLTPARILAVTDLTALAMLATAFGRWRHWSRWLEEHSPVYRTKAGTTPKAEPGKRAPRPSYMYRARPEAGFAKEAEDRLLQLLVQFGMTPSARSRIGVLPKIVDDPTETFLDGPRRSA